MLAERQRAGHHGFLMNCKIYLWVMTNFDKLRKSIVTILNPHLLNIYYAMSTIFIWR